MVLKKKIGCGNFDEEATDIFQTLRKFSHYEQKPVVWNQRDYEIGYLELLTLDEMKKFYAEVLMSPVPLVEASWV